MANSPITNVMRPSIRNSQNHPGFPFAPLISRIPAASKDEMIRATWWLCQLRRAARARQTYVQRRPEESQSYRELLRLVEVSREQDSAGDKPSLECSYKRSCRVEGRPVRHPRLRPGDQTPEEHQRGQDSSEAETLDQQLYGKFCCQEAHKLDRISL